MKAITSIPERSLQDLAFELESEHGSKFLFAVCDDPRQALNARSYVDDRLQRLGKTSAYLSVETLKNDLLGVLSEHSKAGIANVICIWAIDDPNPQAAKRLFVQLNFHRDWLAKLKMPIVLWMPSDLLNQLINIAPDFWSRRTSVYYLTQRSTEELLAKLFPRTPGKTPPWAPEPSLSEAFDRVLTSERELAECLRHKSSFSLQRIDDFIQKIRSGVSQLVEECRSGRQIEVALWLWNLSHLDSDLQEMLDNLGPEQRGLFESLYTDRNEALLRLSEELGSILREYLEALEDHIRGKKRVSLVGRARKFAVSDLNRMAQALVFPTELQIAPDPGALQFDEYLAEEKEAEEFENAFLARAADDLESWLAGHSNRYPSFFSKKEALLLRLLYSDQSGTSAIASRLNLTPRQATETVRFLERKVRHYLGLPPRLPKTRSQSTPARERAR